MYYKVHKFIPNSMALLFMSKIEAIRGFFIEFIYATDLNSSDKRS